jgi:PAS domain S-box-containing protein
MPARSGKPRNSRKAGKVLPGVFEALHQIGVAIGGVLEPLGVARLAAEHARVLLSAEAVGLWVYDEQSDSLRALHLENGSVPSPVPDPRPGDAAIAVPMLVGGRAIGVLGVGFPEPHQATPTAVGTLTCLAAVVAPALEAARLHDAARATRRRLEESEQRFRSMFDYHPDAVFAFDPTGRVTLANPACERLSGYTVEEILTEPRTYDTAEEHDNGVSFFEAALRGEPQRFESVIVHRDGHHVDVWTTQIPIVVDGQVTGVFGIAKDITERVRAKQEREALLQALGTAQQRVQELIARVLRPAEHQERSERRAAIEARVASLTPRELDVLRQLAVGKTNPEIGQALGLSSKAARNRVTDVLAKLGVADRTRAAVLAVELGLAGPGL